MDILIATSSRSPYIQSQPRSQAMQQNFVSTSESLRQMLVEAQARCLKFARCPIPYGPVYQEEAEERLLGKATTSQRFGSWTS